MKNVLVGSVILLASLVLLSGCGDDDNGGELPQFTEQWASEADGGFGTGSWVLKKWKNGEVTVDGTWDYDWTGGPDLISVICPFTDGKVIISDADISFRATGTATATVQVNPPQTSDSPFVLNVSGQCSGETGDGTFEITFSNPLWPVDRIDGTWTATKTSGSGITP